MNGQPKTYSEILFELTRLETKLCEVEEKLASTNDQITSLVYVIQKAEFDFKIEALKWVLGIE